jgi:glucose/mannose transport system substrate-binding protein
VTDASAQEAQLAMASAVMSPEFQVAFNLVKGSVPARTDIPSDQFDACGQMGMAQLAEAAASGGLFGSMAHGHANPPSVQNAMYDVITAHFNGEYDAETAAAELVTAVEIAQ